MARAASDSKKRSVVPCAKETGHGARYEIRCKDRDGIRPDNDDETSMLRAASREAQFVPIEGEHARATVVQKPKPLCGKVDGFTLHAARVVKAKDREGLEKLCRYGLRAPFALDRFSIEPDGKILYRLPRPWPTPAGKTEIIFEPLALMRRLAALLPAPYFNLVRYHGAFANRSKFRPLLPLPPPPRARAGAPAKSPQSQIRNPKSDSEIRPRRLSWAQLLRRVLDVDALTCVKCGAPMIVIAFLSDPKVDPSVKTLSENVWL